VDCKWFPPISLERHLRRPLRRTCSNERAQIYEGARTYAIVSLKQVSTDAREIAGGIHGKNIIKFFIVCNHFSRQTRTIVTHALNVLPDILIVEHRPTVSVSVSFLEAEQIARNFFEIQ
jgi:hypothetical protein